MKNKLLQDIAILQAAAVESSDRNPGMVLHSFIPHLLRVTSELEARIQAEVPEVGAGIQGDHGLLTSTDSTDSTVSWMEP